MGRISGCLWMVAALVGTGAAFLPGSEHEGLGGSSGSARCVFLYGVGSATGRAPLAARLGRRAGDRRWR